MTMHNHLGKADMVTIAAIVSGVQTLVEALDLPDQFHPPRERRRGRLVLRRGSGLIASFSTGISRQGLVVAAIESQWSNCQTGGESPGSKLVKRQMIQPR